ncbi:MAG: putative lipid II flippase FtsW [Holosporales bacterium]|nr:putative lipid II flippase FtsW [Holosporales bacterium]
MLSSLGLGGQAAKMDNTTTTKFSRADRSLIGIWWWTVDRWALTAVFIALTTGVLFSFASTPMVAVKIGLPQFYFVKRHLLYTAMSIATIIAVSLLEVKGMRRLAVIIFLFSAILVVLTPFLGTEIKGARRWIKLGLFTMQPSEFVKPSFAVLSAWMFSEQSFNSDFPGKNISLILYILLVLLLALQPDMGMIFVFSAIWFGQLFLTGISLISAILVCGIGLLGVCASYWLFPYVASRIDRFLDPGAGDCYQINRSIEAFRNGGWFGVGPGEGIIKKYLPDAHADFAFSVIGEEFGALVCVLIVALYSFITFRVLVASLKSKDMFVSFALFGLTVNFALQVIINISSCLRLIPTKGMTLPFISYGGSSMISISICMGMVLGLSRKRPMVLE